MVSEAREDWYFSDCMTDSYATRLVDSPIDWPFLPLPSQISMSMELPLLRWVMRRTSRCPSRL